MSAAEAGGWQLDRGALSTYLGLASIVTWLGAQSPQIYENFKRGSVEGELGRTKSRKLLAELPRLN